MWLHGRSSDGPSVCLARFFFLSMVVTAAVTLAQDCITTVLTVAFMCLARDLPSAVVAAYLKVVGWRAFLLSPYIFKGFSKETH